ncbi:hypothetical protein [Rhodococcus marinonascens]|uniref:hypothetical protein n=1 Tax=Rhodococcus marinonascens TaxID=38311 RepID=UPI000A94C769|nr:hypothetical protein [Rhodococcus marinonascens]
MTTLEILGADECVHPEHFCPPRLQCVGCRLIDFDDPELTFDFEIELCDYAVIWCGGDSFTPFFTEPRVRQGLRRARFL